MKRSRFITHLAGAPFLGALGLTAFGQSTHKTQGQSNNKVHTPTLQRGARVAITAPASALAPGDSLDEILPRLRSIDLEPVVYPSCSGRYYDFSAPDQQRVDELHQAFADPTIEGVMALRGGWGSARLLSMIDFDLLGANPKPLIGYSDITTLQMALYAKTSMGSYHGPTANAAFPKETADAFWSVVSSKESLDLPLNDPDMNTKQGEAIQSGRGSGRLLGGNLTILCSLLGTQWMPSLDGAILCLEDIGEDVYRIDRLLTQLHLSGALNHLNGLLLGTFVDCEPRFTTSPSLTQVIEWVTKEMTYPVWINAPFGHIDKQWTLPMGAMATLDTQQGRLVLHAR
ncbi:MAG: LD-carboxypeptidase [Balneolaceae bacterium]|nr:LD-carboxypeptidase [Balneolaceae bacterium]MDR9446145.1 LD-carboxypeptidase [Balneolaceae bacterium]